MAGAKARRGTSNASVVSPGMVHGLEGEIFNVGSCARLLVTLASPTGTSSHLAVAAFLR